MQEHHDGRRRATGLLRAFILGEIEHKQDVPVTLLPMNDNCTASAATPDSVSVDQVADFWSQAPCGSQTSDAADRRTYFREIEERRYRNEPHIPEVARFGDFAGQRVLEVGCGVGTDGRQFAKAGANYKGINLDEGSTQLAQEAFQLFGLPGTVLQKDAEALDFDDNSFDHVYSFGVIHHSPNTETIVQHMYRVLKPGGTLTVMVYNRDSINYRLEIMVLRKIMRYALWPSFAPRWISAVLKLERDKLERHRQIMMQESMTAERWLSINTDGPDCPLAKVYSASEAKRMFRDAGFDRISTCVRFFDARHFGRLGRLLPVSVVKCLGEKAGWHLMVFARKPSEPSQ